MYIDLKILLPGRAPAKTLVKIYFENIDLHLDIPCITFNAGEVDMGGYWYQP